MAKKILVMIVIFWISATSWAVELVSFDPALGKFESNYISYQAPLFNENMDFQVMNPDADVLGSGLIDRPMPFGENSISYSASNSFIADMPIESAWEQGHIAYNTEALGQWLDSIGKSRIKPKPRPVPSPKPAFGDFLIDGGITQLMIDPSLSIGSPLQAKFQSFM